MRFLSTCFFVFLCSFYVLKAQKLFHWQYTDGQLDTGKVRGLSQNLDDEIEIRLYRIKGKGVKPKKIRLPYKRIQFLVDEKGDTLLQRFRVDGKKVLLQLIYQDSLILYRGVQQQKNQAYYIRHKGVFYPLETRFSRHLAADEILPDNVSCKVPKKRGGYYQAIYFSEKLNNLLSEGDKKKPKKPYLQGRNRLGIGYYYKHLRRIPKSLFYYYRDGEEFLSLHPQFSLIYERQLHKRTPWLYSQLQLRLYDVDETKKYWDSRGGSRPHSLESNISERLQFTTAYVYPGLSIELFQTRNLRPIFGYGMALALPIRFYRTLDNIAISELPRYESLRTSRPVSVGRYFEAGLQFNLSRYCFMGLVYRHEKLMERIPSLATHNITATRYFGNYSLFTQEVQERIQLQLLYSW